MSDTYPLSAGVVKGLSYVASINWGDIEDGKHIISEDIYVNVQSYSTKSDADFEAHREYIDIQYIIEGREYIGVMDYNNCTPKIPYSAENDIEFLSGDGEYTELKHGEFMILYPSDAHKPSISVDKDNPASVRKAVVKVKI